MCRVVTLNNQDFRHSKCSCPSYDKTNICKRIIGVASYFKLFAIPPEIKNLPMGEKRKRGAPKKAIKALVRIQNNNIPIVVGTQQGHTVPRLPLQDIPIQQNIENTSISVSTPVVYNKNCSVRKPLGRKKGQPCTKYPIHGIKACVAKQGDTKILET
ncbi:hypothetical protein BpHYR1_004351 [Brachionus plicatilis]|uniref:SWIM-type domain-containing protein n=1 Tax=Brachionus plicatilis TaxID=10195 RepID=A0A3M7QJM2_BRAPC|nr:hypothetical protein BpHYR1_004351 [Brachionus plicatilis]